MQGETPVAAPVAADAPEISGTPSAAGAAPVQSAGVTDGTVSLTGDESLEEVEKHLRGRYASKLSPNDLDQVLRWRRAGEEAKTTKAEHARLQKEADGFKAHTATLRAIAESLGPDSARLFREEGPQEWHKWATSPPEPESAQPVLDPRDPVQRVLMQLTKEFAELKQGQATRTRQDRLQQTAQTVLSAIDSVKLDFEDDDKSTGKNVLSRLVEFELAAKAQNPEEPTPDEIQGSIKGAHAVLSGLVQLITGAATKKKDESKPKIPVFAATEELPPSHPRKVSSVDKELAEFERRLTRKG